MSGLQDFLGRSFRARARTDTEAHNGAEAVLLEELAHRLDPICLTAHSVQPTEV